MADQDGYPTNEDIGAIYELVDSGTAFQNPCATPIATLKSVIADQTPKLTVLAAISDPNGIPNWIQGNFTPVIAALETLDAALDEFLLHTDRLSGVSFPGDIASPKPSFMALTSVSVTLAQIEAAIGGGTTDAITDFFGSLTEYPATLAIWEEFITDLDLKIQILPPYTPPDYPDQPMPVETATYLSGLGPELDSKRSTETGNYNAGIQKAIKWAMAGNLTQPSGVYRDFIYDIVATPELQALLGAATD